MRATAERRLAVGFFDGLHLGHQAILKGADEVLTFANHPLSVLNPSAAPRLIMSSQSRLAALAEFCRGKVEAMTFDAKLATTPAEAFLERLRGHVVRCGANWRFGRGGEGDVDFLRRHGVQVEVADTMIFNGVPISSSRIRACLEKGELEEATAMLGHAFEVVGRHVRGKGVGTKLGYPTVNVLPEALELKLLHGVYAVECGGKKAVANYGVAPTMGEREWKSPIFELYFPDGVPKLDSDSLALHLKRFLRPERKFSDLDSLTRQIAADIQLCIYF